MSVEHSSRKKTLVKNTFFLYVMSLSSQVISLFTVPYQTRVLSPAVYGAVGFIVSIMTVANLFFSFGFLYSATQEIARDVNDVGRVRRVYTAVFIIKLCIISVVACAMTVVYMLSPALHGNELLLALYYLAYAVGALLPDFLYRGFEQMRVITIRTVAVRLFSALCIFIFLKNESDVFVLPVAMLLGNAVALLLCFRYDSSVLKVSFCRVALLDVWRTFRKSAPFFASRAASTVYQSLNTVVLGAVYPGSSVVGWFSAADKVLSASKTASSPIADSLYPYMVKNRDYKLAMRLLLTVTPVIWICCAVLFMFAQPVCLLVFGEEYGEVGNVLRCLIPAMAVIFPTYIICFPLLVPMGLSRQANQSTFVGLAVQLVALAALLFTGSFDVYTLCLSASASEVSVFLYRLIVLLRYRDRMKCSKGAE